MIDETEIRLTQTEIAVKQTGYEKALSKMPSAHRNIQFTLLNLSF